MVHGLLLVALQKAQLQPIDHLVGLLRPAAKERMGLALLLLGWLRNRLDVGALVYHPRGHAVPVHNRLPQEVNQLTHKCFTTDLPEKQLHRTLRLIKTIFCQT